MASNSRSARASGRMLPPVLTDVIAFRQLVRSTVSLSMSISATVPQRRRTSVFTTRRLRGSG